MNNKRQKNKLFTMLLLVMALLIPQWGWAQTASQPQNGDGSTDNPYIITKAEELAWFRDQVNSGKNSISAKIADDVEVIDLKDFCHAADESQNIEELSWEPIGHDPYIYCGTFDGNGKTVSNLYIKATQAFVGLFGTTRKSTFKNITFENANVTNTKYSTGILVGRARVESTLQNIKILTNCQVNGAAQTGGIAGYLDGNTYNCVNYANVQGTEYVGGIFGYYLRTGNSMTACANYGNVTGTSQNVGGLVGYFASGTIQDSANYGDVKGTARVAGMAGYVDEGKIQNVFSYGGISATNSTEDVGMAFGCSSKGVTEDMVAYYSGAKLTVNGQDITAKAFGSSKLSEADAAGFTETRLESGLLAYLLQQNASNEAKWGQNLADGGDNYPVIGSTHTVYTENLTVNCKTYEVITGSFTNNTTSSNISYQHGQTSHHTATDASCTEAGTKEYWQCQDCHRTYSDSQLTEELTDVTNAELPALGHIYNDEGYCSRCLHYVAVKPSQENGAYQIAKPYHLVWFRDYVNGTVVDEGEAAGTTHPSASAILTADIDLKNYCHAAEEGKKLLIWLPIGNDNNQWKGKMDGQGHTISNLYIKTEQNYVGFFGFTCGATIQDIIFDNAKVENVSTTDTKTDYTGILAGYAYAYADSPAYIKGIKITKNCTVTGQEHTGGIVGCAWINLENCENNSCVKGTSYVGGIAGSDLCFNIKHCANCGIVDGDKQYAGGIIGYAYEVNMQDCANYGKITSCWDAGGIAGTTLNNSSIQNVFSYGDVVKTNNNGSSGIIVGIVYDTLTAKGIIAYNKEALLDYSSENTKTVGTGNITFGEATTEAEVVIGFTNQQIKSGEVAWLLNGSTSTPAKGSALTWYQKLGEDGDEYPVLTQSNGNTVYNNYYTCADKQVNVYSNTEEDAHEKYDKHDKGTETLLVNGLHSSICQRCQTNFMYIKDFCGIDGNDLELTADADGNYKAKDVILNDKTAYNSSVDFTAATLIYNRSFSHDKWLAVYVPFSIDCGQLTDEYEMATINNFHEYEQTDGNTNLELEVKRVTNSGSIPALTPCLIRKKQVSDRESETAEPFLFTDVTFVPAEDKSIDCASVTRYYQFVGTLQGKSDFDENSDFCIGQGNLWPAVDGKKLSPQRWYLKATDRTGGSIAPTAQLSRIGIRVIGDGEATGIEDIHVTTDYGTANGGKQGIYDLQGRKLDKEPESGIYIKNGKKYVK